MATERAPISTSAIGPLARADAVEPVAMVARATSSRWTSFSPSGSLTIVGRVAGQVAAVDAECALGAGEGARRSGRRGS